MLGMLHYWTSDSVDLVAVLEGLVKFLQRVKRSNHSLPEKVQAGRTWAAGGVLCSVGRVAEFILSF